jgi:hypothetical protein
MISFRELTEGITKPIPAAVVIKQMNSARSSIVGKNVTPSNMAKTVQKSLKKFGAEVTFEFASKLSVGEMSANAYYDREADLEGDTAIEITLLFSPKDKGGVTLDNEGFDSLSDTMAKVIAHELLHKSQASNRGYEEPRPFRVSGVSDPKVAEAQKYLGNSDEIEAYSHNIALDLLKNYGSRKNALTALKNFVKIPPDKSPDMFAYLVAFGMDKNHPVLKKLVKKIILYLKELEK